MSCPASCSTDSGVRKPTTVRTLVADRAAGIGAGVAGGVAAAGAVVSTGGRADTAESSGVRFSIGWHPAASARLRHSGVGLIGARKYPSSHRWFTLRRVGSRRFRLFHLLFPRLYHLVRHLGRHLLVRVKLLAVRS